jgi:hypothetical protein
VIKGLEIRSFDVQICSFDSSELPDVFKLNSVNQNNVSLLLFQVHNCAKTAFSVIASLQNENDSFVRLNDDIIISPNSTRLFAIPLERFWIEEHNLDDVPKPIGQFIRVRPEDELTPEQAHAQVCVCVCVCFFFFFSLRNLSTITRKLC